MYAVYRKFTWGAQKNPHLALASRPTLPGRNPRAVHLQWLAEFAGETRRTILVKVVKPGG